MIANLPEMWRPWLAALGVGAPHAERRANCGACVLCSDDDWTASFPRLRYHPDVRCCTYRPGLHNFQVGALLDAELRPQVREAIEAGIRSPLAVPLGLAASYQGDESYSEMVEAGRFGRTTDIRCPYYVADEGACGVWEHRNGICATWFCRHERGMIGLGYWTAVRRLLNAMEWALGGLAVRTLLPGSDGQSWEGWTGTREDLYREAARFVRELDPVEALKTAPREIRVATELVRISERVHRSAGELPEALSYGGAGVLQDLGNRVRIESYTTLDSLVVPTRVFHALVHFDDA
ncbi:MAG TPA: hypothetical protein PKA64_19145, partial [Myxococcota bacterium]|nr:hypothetical protein [Myxococcota bacterium]